MADKKKTVITDVPWEVWHDDLLRRAAGSDFDLQIVKSQVKARVAQLWECSSEDNHGYLVTRIDPGPELCIVLGEGSGMMEFMPEFLAVAKRSGVPVRTHVKNKGLIRMWSRLGLHVDEYVLRG